MNIVFVNEPDEVTIQILADIFAAQIAEIQNVGGTSK